jgi:hypothetical protein
MYCPSASMRGDWSKGGGVRRLSAAVLLSAIDDLYGRSVRMRWDAICWVRSERGGQFSFAFCCTILGLHAQRVRSILERQYVARGVRHQIRKSPLQSVHALGTRARNCIVQP